MEEPLLDDTIIQDQQRAPVVLVETVDDTNVDNNNESEDETPHEVEDDDEEDEDECRVCRGPAEEGRPLFTPCKCSGSMGMTHQDCLTSWLEVTTTRGDGESAVYLFKYMS
jgi:hypothetical protein